MAFRIPSPSSNSFGTSIGQFSEHMPQPVHFVSSTYLGFLRTFTTKFPTDPLISCTSEYVNNSTFGWRKHSIIFGARMHIEQSIVGKVLSSCAILPPMLGDFSTRYTLKPLLARSNEACMPDIPPPITNTAGCSNVIPSYNRSFKT